MKQISFSVMKENPHQIYYMEFPWKDGFSGKVMVKYRAMGKLFDGQMMKDEIIFMMKPLPNSKKPTGFHTLDKEYNKTLWRTVLIPLDEFVNVNIYVPIPEMDKVMYVISSIINCKTNSCLGTYLGTHLHAFLSK